MTSEGLGLLRLIGITPRDDELRYVPGENMPDNPGIKIVGYLSKINGNDLVMRPEENTSHSNNLHGWVISSSCIYSISVLYPKLSIRTGGT